MLSAAQVLQLPAGTRASQARCIPESDRPFRRARRPHLPAAFLERVQFAQVRRLARPAHRSRRSSSSGLPGAVAASAQPDVVLTRESGKNGEMAQRLRDRNIEVLELPLVETGEGPDRERLASILTEENFGYVIITSPESAAVFMAGWRAAGQPQVNIAVVGEGTGKVLRAEGTATLQPMFVPSQADAVHLSAELPLLHDGKHRVLYPASSKAGSDLQNGLAARGVEVLRLNTYTTRQVSSISDEALRLARQARVLAIASPSAIKAWAQIAGLEGSPAVACIGSTSAKAARTLGLSQVYSPVRPGLDGFVDSIMEALGTSPAAAAA